MTPQVLAIIPVPLNDRESSSCDVTGYVSLIIAILKHLPPSSMNACMRSSQPTRKTSEGILENISVNTRGCEGWQSGTPVCNRVMFPRRTRGWIGSKRRTPRGTYLDKIPVWLMLAASRKTRPRELKQRTSAFRHRILQIQRHVLRQTREEKP